MGRRVRTAVTIAVDTDGDGRSSGYGCVVQMTEHDVVLRMGDTLLRVVDAQGFCTGVIRVRHNLELPTNITFARSKSGARYSVAWNNQHSNGEELPTAVYVVDFQTGEVHAQSLPALHEQISDAFVGTCGQQIVVVGSATGKLYTWSKCNAGFSDVLETNEGLSEWKVVDDTAVDAQRADASSCGRFISSAVMGNCFIYVRASQRLNGSILVEEWAFDVDACWTPVGFSSRQLGASAVDSEHELKLFMTDTRKHALLAAGSTLYHFQVSQDVVNSVVKRMPLDHHVVGGAWIEQDTTFAILLANGQISVVHTGDARFELLSISTSSTMSKRLSLSALLGKAVPTALQLVWASKQQQVLVDFGTSCAAFKLEIVGDNRSASLAGDSSLETLSSSLFGSGRKRVMPSLVKTSSDFGDFVRDLLQAKSSPSSNELLDVARTALTRSRVIFEDLYFMLLCIIHQQLIDDTINGGKSRDPIDCIGRSLKVMEMLVSLTVSVDAAFNRQVSQKMLSALPGCGTKSDRKRYYRKEIAAISHQLLQKLSGTSESVDHWAGSAEVTSFLRVYFTPVRALLQEIQSDPKRGLPDTAQGHLLCQWIIEQDEMAVVAEILDRADRSNGSPADRLKLLLLSYTLTCCCLQVNGVVIDMEHFFSLALDPTTLRRQETLRCFLKPWFRFETPEKGASGSDMVEAAAKCAIKANALQLMIKYAMASASPRSHWFIRSLFKSDVANLESAELKVDCLHWQVCEAYIGEAMTILQRIGAQRRFRRTNREENCSTGRHSLSTSIAQCFHVLHETISTKLAEPTKNVGTSKNAVWEFSHLDERLLARVVCLISRIVWHLEASSGSFSSLSKRAFSLNCFGATPTKDKSLWDCITRVRAIFSPSETELRFPRLRQPDNAHESVSLRSQKIVRSLVLIVWAFWAREKVAYCSRSLHFKAKEEADSISDKEALGALAATCGLQLNILGAIYGDNEDFLTIQLSLLEEAATMNPNKVAEAIAWGFPVHRVFTRHLKRYKGLRRLLEQQPTGIALEDLAIESQNLQERIKQDFHLAHDEQYPNEALKIYDTDLNILIGCCCDSEVLQIIAVMTKSPFEPAIDSPAASTSTDPNDGTPHTLEFAEASAVNVEAAQRTNADTGPSVGVKPEELQLSASLISRDEVIALLKAQTQHLEERIQAVRAGTTLEKKDRTRSPSSHKDVQEPQQPTKPSSNPDHDNKAPKLAETVDDDKALVDLVDVQRMARISLQVRDLRRHRYSSASSDVDNATVHPALPAKRHDSVRNALKLFRLRQGNSGLPQGGEEDSNFVSEATSLASASKPKCEKRAPAAVSSGRDKLKRTGVKLKTTRNHRFVQNEPVYPLRLEYGTDSASLKLLGRSSQQRNPSVKRRQFVHQDQKRSSPAKPRTDVSSVQPTDVIQVKTASAQTNDDPDAETLRASSAQEMNELSCEPNDLSPEKSSPVSQECVEDRPGPRCYVPIKTSTSLKGVGTQCDVHDDHRTDEWRRTREPLLPLSIADNFPIWVDLDGANNVGTRQHFKERKKFLQVVRFGGQDAKDHTANNGTAEDPQLFMTPPSESTIIVPRKAHSEPGGDENQSDGQPSPSIGSIHAYGDNTSEQTEDAMKTRHRASYRQHYPPQDRPSRQREDRDAASGIDSLIDLRDNMKRMTQRLRVLETCANSIDEEFKVSQKRLSRIGERRSDGISSTVKVLEDVDEALENTEDTGSQTGWRKSRGGLLSKKASSDLDAAKKLLETIEQLTISADDQCHDQH